MIALRLLATGALACGAVGFALPLPAQSDDRAAVRRAALDYIEGFYEGDSAKLIRSIRPEVHKYGFYRQGPSAAYQGSAMPWPEFLEFAGNVRRRNRPAPASAPKEVQLLDVLDQTAAVKVTAYWGTDYLLLAKYDGRWMIREVLWQSPAFTPATVPANAIAQLGWLTGRWRGSGGGYDAFFEEYVVRNDSTMVRHSFSDSTFVTATDSAVFERRGNRLIQRRDGRMFPATLVNGDSVRLVPASGGGSSVLFVREGTDGWRAVLDSGREGRPAVVYTMRRVRRR